MIINWFIILYNFKFNNRNGKKASKIHIFHFVQDTKSIFFYYSTTQILKHDHHH